MEGDEDLLSARSLRFIQPLRQLFYLFVVHGSRGVPRRGCTIVVFPGPQENEASAAVIELVDELFVRNPEFFQVRKSGQQTFDIRVVPHFVIADGGKNATG